jgi:dTDP-4-dehydrorhamnose 3,5-epimerase
MDKKNVEIIPLKKNENQKGFLMELLACNDKHFTTFGDAYLTATHAGLVKAWYRHRIQTDRIALVSGEVLLVLYDANSNNNFNKEIIEIELTETKPQLIIIPPLIWHGFKSIGNCTAIMIHLNDTAYNESNLDEERLDVSNAAIPYRFV